MKTSKNVSHEISLTDMRLQRIADVLFLNASFNDNPGLLTGKMGIAIFLYHYARSTGNDLYDTYAGELIDEIYSGMSTKTPVDFANGLTGIGWGIQYLVKNRFVEADTDEALAEIDNAVYNAWLKRSDLSGDKTDIFGYGFYYLTRLQGKGIDNINLKCIGEKRHLISLIDEYEKLLINNHYRGSNILSLNTGIINSIAWFLLEMYRLNLAQGRVGKLIQQLPAGIEFNSKPTENWSGNFVSWHIMQNIIPLIINPGIQQKCMAIVKPWAYKSLETNLDNEIFVNNFSALACQKLIYSPYIKEDTQITQLTGKTFKIIDEENNWSQRLDNLNKNNMGLTGLAGLGLGLINETIINDRV